MSQFGFDKEQAPSPPPTTAAPSSASHSASSGAAATTGVFLIDSIRSHWSRKCLGVGQIVAVFIVVVVVLE
jgi:hypothetical protein